MNKRLSKAKSFFANKLFSPIKFLKNLCSHFMSKNNIRKNIVYPPQIKNSFLYFNIFLGVFHFFSDGLEYFSILTQGNQAQALIDMLFNIFLTFFSILLLFKQNLYVMIAINGARIFSDFHTKILMYEKDNVDTVNIKYLTFFDAQYMLMLAFISTCLFKKKFIKVLVFVFFEFYFLVLLLFDVRDNYLSIFKMFSFVYVNIFAFIFYSNLIEKNTQDEIQNVKKNNDNDNYLQILNFISNGIIIMDLDEKPNLLFANKIIKDMFDVEMENFNFDILENRIKIISDRIYVHKSNKFKTLYHMMEEKNVENFTEDGIEIEYYDQNYRLLSQYFSILRENFDFMHKKNISQQITLVTKQEKKIEVNIKAFFYQEKKTFLFSCLMPEKESTQNEQKIEKNKSNSLKRILLAYIGYVQQPLAVLFSTLSDLKGSETNKSEITMKLDHLNPIIGSINYQLSLINTLIDFMLIDQNQILIRKKSINIYAFVQDLKIFFKRIAEIKCISFSIVIDPQVPQIIYTDERRLKQILTILFDNALRNIMSGYIKIKITFSQNASKFKFSIKDSSPGLSQENIKRLLDILSHPSLKKIKKIAENSNEVLLLAAAQALILLLNRSEPFALFIKSKEKVKNNFFFFLESDAKTNIEKSNISNSGFSIMARDQMTMNDIDLNKKSDIHKIVISKSILEKYEKIRKYSLNLLFDNGNEDFTKSEIFHENGTKISTDLRNYVNTKITIASHRLLSNPDISQSSISDAYFCEDILIINNSHFYLFALAEYIAREKLSYNQTFDIAQAISTLSNKFDPNYEELFFKIVFIELSNRPLENINKLKLLKRMREENSIENVAIIGYCSFETKADLYIYKENGMDEVLFMPIEKDEFRNIVGRWILAKHK